MPTRRVLSSLFTPDEIAQLTARSDLHGAWAVLFTWGVIAACFTVLSWFANPLVFVGVVVVLGGRQLALAVLAHESAHRSLFRTPWLNDFVGDWLCARLVWTDVRRYRVHHLRHHSHTGTGRDPDMSLVTPFPITRKSLAKKFLRDLTGQTAPRRIAAQFLMDIGVFEYTVAAKVTHRPRAGRSSWDYAREGVRNLSGVVLTNLALAGVLAAFGQASLYWAWAVAYLTTFSLYIRIRSIAEHACLEESPDMFRNTRTTTAGLLARMTFVPHRVNYHLEHHLMAAVPFYRLPRLHSLLRERGMAGEPPNYAQVLRLASSRIT
ncbi:MAG: fatty acid desaturase family protein [Panacagrimonas sp.]